MLPIIKSMYLLQNQCFWSSAVGEFEKMLNMQFFHWFKAVFVVIC